MSNWLFCFLVEKSLRCWFLKRFAILYICIKSWKGSERISWLAEKPAMWRKTVTVFCNWKKQWIAPWSLRASQKVKGRSHRAHRVQVCTLSAAAGNKTADPSKSHFLVFIFLGRNLAVCSLCKYSPPSLLALPTVLHRPGGTTDCSCRHTGPSLPETQQDRDHYHFLCCQFEQNKNINQQHAHKCIQHICRRLLWNPPHRPLALGTMVQHTASSPPLNLKEQGQTLCEWENLSSWFLHSSLCFSLTSFCDTSWASRCAESRSCPYAAWSFCSVR